MKSDVPKQSILLDKFCLQERKWSLRRFGNSREVLSVPSIRYFDKIGAHFENWQLVTDKSLKFSI